MDTQEIETLKAKHGKNNLFQVDVTDADNEIYSFVCVKPTKSTLKAILTHKNNEEKILETLVSNCVVSDNKDELNNADVYSKVAEEIAKKIQGAKAEVKKL